MKRTGRQAIETHDISQKKYPMPGTDLGTTNACPFNEAYDVDISGGRQSEYCLGRGDEYSCFSRTVQGSREALKPASNPTRMPREREPWEMAVSQPAVAPRKRK